MGMGGQATAIRRKHSNFKNTNLRGTPGDRLTVTPPNSRLWPPPCGQNASNIKFMRAVTPIFATVSDRTAASMSQAS